MAKTKAKTKSGTPKSYMFFSFVMLLTVATLVFVVFTTTNADANKMLKEWNFFVPPNEEFYTDPMDVISEFQGSSGTTVYMRANISLSFKNEKTAEAMNSHGVKLNDIYIRVLSTKTPEYLKSVEGQAEVKEEMLRLIEEETSFPVEGIYFTKWIFQ